jgi:hypothetical protein
MVWLMGMLLSKIPVLSGLWSAWSRMITVTMFSSGNHWSDHIPFSGPNPLLDEDKARN